MINKASSNKWKALGGKATSGTRSVPLRDFLSFFFLSGTGWYMRI
jgi:hypothetical protein